MEYACAYLSHTDMQMHCWDWDCGFLLPQIEWVGYFGAVWIDFLRLGLMQCCGLHSWSRVCGFAVGWGGLDGLLALISWLSWFRCGALAEDRLQN
jgi:hypothetical protein